MLEDNTHQVIWGTSAADNINFTLITCLDRILKKEIGLTMPSQIPTDLHTSVISF